MQIVSGRLSLTKTKNQLLLQRMNLILIGLDLRIEKIAEMENDLITLIFKNGYKLNLLKL